MIKAVILDLDDTTFMTEAACFDLENDTLIAMGRKPMSRELHLATWGKPLFDAIKVRSPGVDVSQFRKAYDPVLEDYVRSGRLDAISDTTLSAIDDMLNDLKLHVLALTAREYTEIKHLQNPSHPLFSRFEAIYYKDIMKYHKPDPRAFDHIEREHGWKPNECVYVGDSVIDAQSAKGGGLHFIVSLESGLRKKSDFSGYDVDAFINDFSELCTALTAIDPNLRSVSI